MSMLTLALLPTLSFGVEGWYGNMYRCSYYNTNYSTTMGVSAFASLKNLDSYDDGVADIYMQNHMEFHRNWITQCSKLNQKVDRNKQIGCNLVQRHHMR